MDWFLYDNGLRHERVKKVVYILRNRWSIDTKADHPFLLEIIN